MKRRCQPRRAWVAILLAVLLTGLPTLGAPRAEMLKDWRAGLERALRAEQDGRAQDAADEYTQILSQADARHETGMLVARANDGLADVHRSQRRFAAAVPFYESATAQWRALLGPTQPRLAVTLHNLGLCYVETGQWESAERVLNEALGIWRGSNATPRIAETETLLRAARQRSPIPWR